MDQQIRILILEDVTADAEMIERELRNARVKFTSQVVGTKEGFAKALTEFVPDVILSDYTLPQFSGLEALQLLKESDVRVPFILVTGSLTEEIAVLCMKQGADDYILKTALKRLPSAVLAALKASQTEKERTAALEALRESQEQLRQSQKLEAIGRLAGGIAHDFNNLLTVIGGYCDLLLTTSALNDSDRERMEEVNKAAQRATSLVRQLLAFSRKQMLQPEVLNPNCLIENIIKMLERLIGDNIEIAMSLGSDVGQINVDPGQFDQVLTNLVVNARDAMPNGGKITIETENVKLVEAYSDSHFAVEAGSYVMLAVSDTGNGIDAETQNHIFEPFFTTKELGKGTGLGLSTVYGIVKQSGGNICVYSEPGRGTTFKIYLPRVDADVIFQSAAREVEEQSLTKPAETILLVEDEDRVRKLASDFLTARGYRVLSAKDCDEALSISQNHFGPIELLLTDVVMPKMGGKLLSESIKALRTDLKVLYMSGYTDEAISRHGILDRETNFLEKPFTANSLASKVREVLANGRATKESSNSNV